MGKESRRILVELRTATEKEARSLVLRIHKRLRQTTPVLTGWARSNWIPSIGTPFKGTAGSKQSLDENPNRIGIQKILRWRFLEGPAYLVNNVPYIQKLNDGSSKQAPRNFIEMAIQTETSISNRKKLS